MELSTKFECGGGKRLTRLGENRWRIEAAGEVDDHNKYFCVRAAANPGEPAATMHLDVYPDSDMGESGAEFFASHFPSHIWYCAAGWGRWAPLRNTREDSVVFHQRRIELRVPVTPGGEVYVASNPPRRYSEMLTWLESLRERDGGRARIDSIGTSAEGRDIPVVRLPGSKPGSPKFLVLAGQHPSEHGGVWASEGIAEYCLSHIREAREIATGLDVAVIPMVNPDGNVRGLCAANAEGLNLCTGFRGAADGALPMGAENRLLWEWLCSEFPPDALLHFHAGLGWRVHPDHPYDGAVLFVRGGAQFYRDEGRAAAYRAMHDRLLFETPGHVSRQVGGALSEEYLEYQLAARLGTLGILYHVNAGAVGADEQFRRGPQVFGAMTRALLRDTDEAWRKT